MAPISSFWDSSVAGVLCDASIRIFVVCSGANADYVKHLGATEVIDYTEGDIACAPGGALPIMKTGPIGLPEEILENSGIGV